MIAGDVDTELRCALLLAHESRSRGFVASLETCRYNGILRLRIDDHCAANGIATVRVVWFANTAN